MRLILASVISILFIAQAQAQRGASSNAEDLTEGHFIAKTECATCHLAAPDQPYPPIRQPPAPPFASIVQQKKYNAETLTHFLNTTHEGLDMPNGMPDLYLMDYQVKQVVAYFLSLYK
jgi:mono/diheme cytochrome c family protein